MADNYTRDEENEVKKENREVENRLNISRDI